MNNINIKIFSGNSSEEVEKSINEWADNNPNCRIINIYPHIATLYDLYDNAAPQVCNYWNEYVWTIVYEVKNR